MSDFFARVAQRALGVADTLTPRLPSRFEPDADAAPDLPLVQAEDRPPNALPKAPGPTNGPVAPYRAEPTAAQRPPTTASPRQARQPRPSDESEPASSAEVVAIDAPFRLPLSPAPSAPTPAPPRPTASGPRSASESETSTAIAAPIATASPQPNGTPAQAERRSPVRARIEPSDNEREGPRVGARPAPIPPTPAMDRAAARNEPSGGHEANHFESPSRPSRAGLEPIPVPIPTPIPVPDLPRREQPAAAAPGPTIKVSIGRVEVRAVVEAGGDARKPQRSAPSTASLQDFLQQHAQRRRR